MSRRRPSPSASSSQPNKALFIRSTEAPLQKLAEEIFKLASEGYQFESPEGLEYVPLNFALVGMNKINQFTNIVVNDLEKLVDTLRTIAVALPVTFVLVIDQGEEVLSLGTGLDLDEQQSKYFKFLALFGASKFPLKVIIALRNEFYGDFQGAINEQSPEPMPIHNFRLGSLGAKGLIAAITRPTQSAAVEGYGLPPYGFSFEDGLPERIVNDLVRTAKTGGLVGGELPMLQVVCETLYRNVRMRPKPWVISDRDYKALGEIETQLNDYVDRLLITFSKTKGKPIARHAIDILRWKDALTGLAKRQANSTVTTDRKTLADLEAPRGTSPQDFQELLRYLAEDELGVLRDEKIRRLGSNVEVPCYSLRHDAVGFVLIRWKDAREATRGILAGFDSLVLFVGGFYMLFGLVLTASITAKLLPMFHGGSRPDIQFNDIIAMTTGLVIMIFGTFLPYLSERHYRRTPKEFIAFKFQLLGVLNPLFMLISRRGRRLTKDDLGDWSRTRFFGCICSRPPVWKNSSFERTSISKVRSLNGNGRYVGGIGYDA